MRIVNNRIYISKGETPTYDVMVLDKDNGAPFVIPAKFENPVIEFIVRPSVYDREDDYVLRMYLDASHMKRFDVEEPLDYIETSWDNNVVPDEDKINRLYRRAIGDEYDYRYYDANATYDPEKYPESTENDYKWIPYEFELIFQFPYSSTSLMEAKTYKYEIALFDANLVDGDHLENIMFKKFLLEATDFVVGGSLSE